LERWHGIRELHGKTCEELAGIAYISTTLREQEAGPKTLLFKESASDSACNRRLSRPS
jgi:hypothetical protein